MSRIRLLIRLLVVVSLVATPLFGGLATACAMSGEQAAQACACENCGENDSPQGDCPHIVYPLPRAQDAAVPAAAPIWISAGPALSTLGPADACRMPARDDAPDPPPPR